MGGSSSLPTSPHGRRLPAPEALCAEPGPVRHLLVSSRDQVGTALGFKHIGRFVSQF